VNTSLRDLLSDTQPPVHMEFPSWAKGLGSEQIAKLQAENEGDVRLGRISGNSLPHWERQNPRVLVDENIYIKYNFISENIIIKCMSTAAQDLLGLYFAENVSGPLNEMFGRSRVR